MHVPPSDPMTKTLHELLNATSTLVGLPPLPALSVTPQALSGGRSAAELQALLDAVLARQNALIVLTERVREEGGERRLPSALVLTIVHTTDGCIEATRTIAEHVRARINDQLERCLDQAA